MTISYHPIAHEELVFRQAFDQHLPLLIKGPTGCGKTRFVEYMAQQLNLPMWTVACNEDTSASDLVGRYILKGNETPWMDGPLTQAVRQGGICYLDEVIEARQEALVVLNALADHRRQLFIDKTNEVLMAPPHFMLVVSYNPGYQSVMRDLKESIKQRFVAVRFDYPAIELEQQIIVSESACPSALALALAHFGASSRKLAGSGLFEGVSTRMLIHAAKMLATSREQSHLLEAALIDPVTDEPNIRASLLALLPLVIAAI